MLKTIIILAEIENPMDGILPDFGAFGMEFTELWQKLLAGLWGISIIADSAQFSTCITELAPTEYVGTTLTMQTCVGFALTTISIWLIPPVAKVVGWRWAFSFLAIGPILGVLAMYRLRALPESLKLADGRR